MGAFMGCKRLTSITIPESVTSIEDSAFEQCGYLSSVTIPNSVMSIGNRAFCSCERLTSIGIGNSVTSIGDYAFSGCICLTTVIIGNSVTSIGGYAFWYCNKLSSITIPNSVTSIDDYAFSCCSGLTSVTMLSTTPPYNRYNYIFDRFYDRDKAYQRTLHVLPGCKANFANWQFSPYYFTIVEDATTGINDVYGSATNSADKIFSTSGQRLNKVGKGVNIINGKKVLSK